MSMIHELIPKVMADVEFIGKDRKNVSQGYSFRGVDDIYNALHQTLSKHGVFCVPTVVDLKREERTSSKGSVLIYTVLTIKYTFYAPDGSNFEAVVIGEGMDSGDKSGNKAMSGAQKYALLQVFCIPTEEPKDSENDSPEVGKKAAEKKTEALKEKRKVFDDAFKGAESMPLDLTYEGCYEKVKSSTSVFQLDARVKKYAASFKKCADIEKQTLKKMIADKKAEFVAAEKKAADEHNAANGFGDAPKEDTKQEEY